MIWALGAEQMRSWPHRSPANTLNRLLTPAQVWLSTPKKSNKTPQYDHPFWPRTMKVPSTQYGTNA